MGFINDDVLPRNLAEMRLFHQAHLVRCDADFKIQRKQTIFDKFVLKVYRCQRQR
jgi:hypothetical protein